MKIYNSELVSVDSEGVETYLAIGLPINSEEELAARSNYIKKCLSEASVPELRFIDRVKNVGYYEVGGNIFDTDANSVESDFLSNEFAQLIEGNWAKKELKENDYLLYKSEKDTWLEVSYGELVDLDIDEKISNKSKKNGLRVFLCEEDQKLFEKHKKKTGATINKVELKSIPSNHIESYKDYE